MATRAEGSRGASSVQNRLHARLHAQVKDCESGRLSPVVIAEPKSSPRLHPPRIVAMQVDPGHEAYLAVIYTNSAPVGEAMLAISDSAGKAARSLAAKAT